MRKESDKFVVATMNVTDDVEGSGLRFLVVVKRNTFESDGFRLFRRRKYQNMAKSFALQAAKRATQILKLAMCDMIAETTVGADLIAVLTDSFRHIENDGDREAMILPRELHKRFAIFGLYISGIGDGQSAGAKTLRSDEMENFERVIGCGEIIFVIRNHRAAIIG